MNVIHQNSLEDFQILDIAKLNVEAFKRYPMNEVFPNLTVEQSYEYHKSHVNREGFICALGYDKDKLMGYSWGISAQSLDKEDIELSKLEFLTNQVSADKSLIHFSGSTCTLEPRLGLGYWMISSRIKRSNMKYVITRYHTDNNPIKKIYRELYGSPLTILKDNMFKNAELALYEIPIEI